MNVLIAVQILRGEAAYAVSQSSLRAASREIGISPTGLKKFLGGSNPYSPTLRRLRRWYADRKVSGAGSPTIDAELVAIALNVLVREFSPAVALDVRDQVYACLDAAYGVAIPRVVLARPCCKASLAACRPVSGSRPYAAARLTPVSWSIQRPSAFAG